MKPFSHTISDSNLNVGKTVSYYSFANDTSGNEAKTEIKSFTVEPVEVVTTEPSVPEEIETVSIKEEHEMAEINKPVKWSKELVISNPSTEDIKNYVLVCQINLLERREMSLRYLHNVVFLVAYRVCICYC